MARRRPLSPAAKAVVLEAYGEFRPMLETPVGPAAGMPVEQPNPELAKKKPRGRSIEEVARIVADAEELGPTAAARRHRMSASGVSAMAARWRRHPTVMAAIRERQPAIQARLQAKIDRARGDLDALVRKLVGG